MSNFGYEDEEFETNQEIRMLTLELMKIAIRKKLPFNKVVDEFIQNSIYLKEKLEKID